MKSKTFAGWVCAALIVAVSANAQTTFVPGILKREFFPGATRLQVETNPPAPASITYPDSWNVTDDTQNYTARFSGLISPTTSGLYDFYIAADDDSDLFISTNWNPVNKFMIAQETLWSPALNWNTPDAGGIASQKNSAMWTNGAGATPYSGGINLVAGTRYYLEAVQHGGPGGNRLAVTMVPHNNGIGDGTDTILTNTSPEATIGISNSVSLLLFQAAGQPTGRTNFYGTSATFRATPSHNSAIPPRFQWLRNGVEIPGATNATGSTSFYTIVASTNDNGAQFRCVAYVPGIGPPARAATSSVATLTVPFSSGLFVPGRLKRELFTGLTQPFSAHFLTNLIEKGNVGFPNAVNPFTAFDVPTAGANYGERVSGFFTPATSAYYHFFLSSDDESHLFVSTNDQPSGKVLVAQEDGASTDIRDWLGNTASLGSIPSQKRSDQWSPDGGTTVPYINGFFMAAGGRYYIEAVHWGGLANNHVEVTTITSNQVASGLPLSGDFSTLTNGTISYVTKPVLIFNITNQPVDIVRFEGLPYTFSVGIQTDSEVNPSYQWRKNGQPIIGAIGPRYTSVALVPDNGATFTCDISIPGVITTNSATATLSVIQGTFAEGILRREFWTNADSRGITRTIVGANAGGFPDPDYQLFIDTLDISESRDNEYVQRVSGFFVPPVTTNYVFFLATDDDSDLYISTDQQPANKYLIAQETVWSSARQWLTANGGGSVTAKRSDQFNGGIYAAGIPLTNGVRYYLEVVHNENTGGEAVSVTFKYIDEPDPANNTPTRLTGAVIGTPVPAATALGITTNPASVTTYGWQPVYFTVASTNDSIVPSTFQWRRNGTNIPDRTSASFGFVTSSNDNGAQFDCVVRAPGTSLILTSTPATLTILSGGTLVNGSLARETWNIGIGVRVIEAGGLGGPDTKDTVTGIDFGALGPSYATRIRGFFVPPETTNYVFFICSDDTADLFLSTNDQPSGKTMIAQEEGFSDQRQWLSATSGNPALKRSDTWTPDGGVTMPFSGGIWMTNGRRYYLEAVHTQQGGGDNFGVTYKMGIDPVNDPLSGDPSILTNGVIAYMQAPQVTPQPIITATKSGNTLTVSWTPPGGTLQSSPTLAPAIWTLVGVNNPTILTIGTGNLFLRVSVP